MRIKRSLARGIPAAAVLLAAATAEAAIDRGPFLQPTDDLETTIGVAWRTENADAGTVDYGISVVSENSSTEPSATTDHFVVLTGLSPGTTYKYQVVSDGTTTPVYTFRTSSSTAERRVIVLSDVHAQAPGTAEEASWTARQNYMMPDMIAFDPDVVVITGDAVETGSDASHYDTLFTGYAELFATAIVAPAPGNHEWAYDTDLPIYTAQWHLPQNCSGYEEKNYYFDYGGVRFVVVANSVYSSTETWFQNSLAAAVGNANFIVAANHYPIYLSCEFDDEMAGDISVESWKVSMRSALEANQADLQLAGHRHLYHRTFPILSTLSSPACTPAIGSGWGGPETAETTNYQDPAGVIYLELSSTWYQKDLAIYQRPFFAAVGPEEGDGGTGWLGYTTMVVAGRVCTVDTFVFAANGSVGKTSADHFVLDKSGGYSISGTVTEDGSPLQGARVEADSSHFGYTNALGQYSIVGLQNGTHTVTPSKLGYVFFPASQQAAVSDADVTGVDFAGTNTGGTVVLQNGLDGYSGADDTMIRASSADSNYGDHEEIRAVMGASSVDRATLIRFDLSAIPAGSLVSGAVLEIYLWNKAGSGNFHAGTMGVDWQEMEATWNQAQTGTAWPGGGAIANATEFLTVPQGSSDAWVSFTVSSALQAWVDGGVNYGFCIWPDGTVDDRFWSSDYAVDASLRPKLTVTYAAGGPRPPTVSISADRTRILQGESVAFTADAQDPDGTIVLYEWDFDGDGAYEQDTGTTPTVSHAFAAAGTFSVRARVTDDEGLTAVSDPVTIVVEADSDGDGMPDDWETANLLDPFTDDSSDDADGDGLINIDEYHAGTDPQDPDTDADGIPDGDDRNPLGPPLPLSGGCGGAGAGVALAVLALLALLRRREA